MLKVDIRILILNILNLLMVLLLINLLSSKKKNMVSWTRTYIATFTKLSKMIGTIVLLKFYFTSRKLTQENLSSQPHLTQ